MQVNRCKLPLLAGFPCEVVTEYAELLRLSDKRILEIAGEAIGLSSLLEEEVSTFTGSKPRVFFSG